ncbi:hypothetical protein JM658_15665 [Joostella atrarenae]|uniref:Uncharacterized protein n=1 Tax=Joostella atrarenae TaxID=679257 RepID=A0ABS9J758_9FLAO|nr:hypothetical protein [Joostella atrarenae]MCF8716268.1 hypothetical protein [Joostella atrarenae]
MNKSLKVQRIRCRIRFLLANLSKVLIFGVFVLCMALLIVNVFEISVNTFFTNYLIDFFSYLVIGISIIFNYEVLKLVLWWGIMHFSKEDSKMMFEYNETTSLYFINRIRSTKTYLLGISFAMGVLFLISIVISVFFNPVGVILIVMLSIGYTVLDIKLIFNFLTGKLSGDYISGSLYMDDCYLLSKECCGFNEGADVDDTLIINI